MKMGACRNCGAWFVRVPGTTPTLCSICAKARERRSSFLERVLDAVRPSQADEEE